jgi:hypothetical protein
MGGGGYLQQKQSGAEDKYNRIGEWHAVIAPNLCLSVDFTSFMRIHSPCVLQLQRRPQNNSNY